MLFLQIFKIPILYFISRLFPGSGDKNKTETEQKLKYNQVPKIPKSNSIEPAFDPDHEETTSKLLFQCYRVGAILNKNQNINCFVI